MTTEKISCRIDSDQLNRFRMANPGMRMTTIISILIDNSLIEGHQKPVETDGQRTTSADLSDSQATLLADKPTEVNVIPLVKEDRYLQAWWYMNSIKD